MSTASEKWAAMRPVERNLWIAENVMGDTTARQQAFVADYCGDPGKDYLVLEKARTWKASLRVKFNDAMATLHYEHSCRRNEPLVETYRVGDWSHAAYLALERQS